jgi:hypothetical protein
MLQSAADGNVHFLYAMKSTAFCTLYVLSLTRPQTYALDRTATGISLGTLITDYIHPDVVLLNRATLI